MYNPVSTYRIQFHKDFTFKDLEAIIPYLEQLGIGTVYASPIFKAVPGSMHGYDGVDPLQINPEIGTLAQLRKLKAKLRAKGIGWVQDIVPNHLAFHSDNSWLMDVLEKGPQSAYFNFFDIITPAAEIADEPLMVPFLGASLEEVINNGELKVIWQNDKLRFDYAGNTWPLNERSNQLLFPKTKKLMGTKALKQALQVVNKDTALLKKLADSQFYRLCSWQETDQRINYRRFFTVNGLICLNMQRPEVFAAYHDLIGQLVKEKVFDGLRIDHIDGLYDPQKYLQELRALTGPATYITVEKILEPGEAMPADWPIEGNTGYDFLGLVSNVMSDQAGEAKLNNFYRGINGDQSPVRAQVSDKKRNILTRSMAGEWENLTRLFIRLELVSKKALAKVSFDDLKAAIGELLISCPVYRYYGNSWPLSAAEHSALDSLLTGIKKRRKNLQPAVEVLQNALSNSKKVNALKFYQRVMQFTGPLMAKGVEDTLMYTNSHFILHNEVGDSPAAAGLPVAKFHQAMAERQENWPLSMNGTATHDTKRGEDVRARLQVLPYIADEWLAAVNDWLNTLPAQTKLAKNDLYFLLQTILGAHPMPGEPAADFKERLAQYLEKSLREGKEHSNWAEPDLAYETALKEFAGGLLHTKGRFWKSFKPVFEKVAGFGVLNSLAQVLLKFTCPGVPDVYQGCDHWDFSLVDPDNRRPVDYLTRQNLLEGLEEKLNEAQLQDLWDKRLDGRLKMWLTRLLTKERKSNPSIFEQGDYLPLTVKGKFRDKVLAFARHDQQDWYVVALPLGAAALIGELDELTAFDWGDTHILLPANAPQNGVNLILNGECNLGRKIPLNDVFHTLPFALLKLTRPENKRGAGILLPLASLPSPYGIGDLGPQARQFVDTLAEAGQKYWQLLPLSPVSAGQQYSPYSSYASFAGNEWYISPEVLLEDGLLVAADLEAYHLRSGPVIDYQQSARIKDALLEKAWANYQAGDFGNLETEFFAFCKQEKLWLSDYALYAALRRAYHDDPWYDWPEPFKLRDQEALEEFARQQELTIKKFKWLQFIFTRQLLGLKIYANRLGVRLFGDLPFYVSYDSADVWANRELFSLDKDGRMLSVAGVPPDYFNANGQLWGMPVFNWQKLAETGFEWWLRRIEKNLAYYDLLRLDHFRAFASYWAVPAAETTAIHGEWVPAPGLEFFKLLNDRLGELPLVAEDLGDIDEAVYTLRDTFRLPGMKVLQFAWGPKMAVSPHMPHNYSENFVVYTGTHDNNTTRGWYRKDADKQARKSLRDYFGGKLKGKEVSINLVRLALSSTAQTAIIPIQDWLNLSEKARLNTPAATVNNWVWRITEKQLAALPCGDIVRLTTLFNRS